MKSEVLPSPHPRPLPGGEGLCPVAGDGLRASARADGPAIGIIVDGLPVGGTERQVVELLGGLKAGGRFRAVLGVLDHGGGLEDEADGLAAAVLPLRRRGRFDVTPAAAVYWHGRRAQVRLLHAFGWMSGLTALVAGRCLGIPVINGSIRSAPPFLPWRERLSRWTALRSDVVVANTAAGLRAFRVAQHPRATVIANGIRAERFVMPEAASSGAPVICMVANFNEYKDHAGLIRAFMKVREVVPAATLVLVGRDAGTLADTRRVVQELGAGDVVTIVTDCDRPERFMARSAVCVLASPSTHGEGMSNVLLEYLALGRPVVATNDGGTAEVVRHGETGLLVDDRTPDALAACILDLLSDPEGACRMGEAGRRLVQERFSAERMVAEYEALYASLI